MTAPAPSDPPASPGPAAPAPQPGPRDGSSAGRAPGGPGPAAVLDAASARRVLLLRAVETTEGVPAATWSPEDRAWASRLAGETAPADAGPARWLAERARHAFERLGPRDPTLAALARRPRGRGGWLPAFALAAFFAGIATDGLAGGRHIDLLSPPLALLLLWNLVAYGLVLLNALRGPGPRTAPGLRRLMQWLVEPVAPSRHPAARAFVADWAARQAPATAARAMVWLHVAAAAFAAGMVAGLYLRGLVLDFRAGWQSTFLEPATVRALLAGLLAPASAITGIALPDEAAIAALRVAAAGVAPGGVVPGGVATGPAAPWIHLFAATIGSIVVLPRLVLAALAGAAAWRRGHRIALVLGEPYFARLLVQARRQHAHVRVVPHGPAPGAQAALALQALFGRAFGETVHFTIAPAVGYGDEGEGEGEGVGLGVRLSVRAGSAAPAAAPAATLQVMLVDLAATPEPEAHGRLLARLRAGGAAVLLLADEAAWQRRFGGLPERLEPRRAAWRGLAAAQGAAFAAIDLDRADHPAALAALEAALADPAGAAGAPSAA